MIFKEKQKLDVQIQFRCTKDERELLKEVAQKHDLTVSEVIKFGINEFIEKLENKQGE